MASEASAPTMSLYLLLFAALHARTIHSLPQSVGGERLPLPRLRLKLHFHPYLEHAAQRIGRCVVVVVLAVRERGFRIGDVLHRRDERRVPRQLRAISEIVLIER